MSKLFYMCFVEGGDSPRHQHETLKSAKKEAKRLATLTGKPVHVLEAQFAVTDTTANEKSFAEKVEEFAKKNNVPRFVAATEIMRSEVATHRNPLFPFGGVDFGNERFSGTIEFKSDEDFYKPCISETKSVADAVRDLEQENENLEHKVKALERQIDLMNRKKQPVEKVYKFDTTKLNESINKLKNIIDNAPKPISEKHATRLAKIKSFFEQYGGEPGPKYVKWIDKIINKYY